MLSISCSLLLTYLCWPLVGYQSRLFVTHWWHRPIPYKKNSVVDMLKCMLKMNKSSANTLYITDWCTFCSPVLYYLEWYFLYLCNSIPLPRYKVAANRFDIMTYAATALHLLKKCNLILCIFCLRAEKDTHASLRTINTYASNWFVKHNFSVFWIIKKCPLILRVFAQPPVHALHAHNQLVPVWHRVIYRAKCADSGSVPLDSHVNGDKALLYSAAF